jgi:integrase
MRRKSLSDLGVAALKPRATRYAFPDPELRGHYIRISPTGAKSYAVVRRDPGTGKQIWAAIGSADAMKIEDARDKARAALQRIGQGLPPIAPTVNAPETFRTVAENWIKRHVEAKGLRSRGEIERALKKYVYPDWADRMFTSIQRADVATLLDRIEDDHGARQADIVLAYVRKIANWYATRADGYSPPFVKGMARQGLVKRDRVLSDEEIRVIWWQAEKQGQFGAIVRLALLTAQRRERLASMRWEDISGDVWNVPTEARGKGTGGALKLPAAAKAVVDAQPVFKDNPHVFAGRKNGSHFGGFSKCKAAFDEALPKIKRADGAETVIDGWTIHDLRRTARSLMARAGVRPDIAERVLGHVIAGVEGVYDRHKYDDEKGEALASLAAMIERILIPPAGNVVILEGRRK